MSSATVSGKKKLHVSEPLRNKIAEKELKVAYVTNASLKDPTITDTNSVRKKNTQYRL